MTTSPAPTFAPAAMIATVPTPRIERKECHYGQQLIALLCFALLLSLLATAHADTQTLHLENISGEDTYITDVTPNTSFSGQNTLKVGGYGIQYDTLIKFSVNSLQNSISSVKLFIYCDSQVVRPSLYRISSTWSSTTTWNSRPTSVFVQNLPYSVAGQWTSIDITQMVIGWRQGAPNYGLRLHSNDFQDESNDYRSLEFSNASFRPYIVVTDDSDDDGIGDVQELDIYGTNPLLKDTDGDGMDDAWEIANALNPLADDANGDRDLDGLTNKEEYDQRANGYKANAVNSKAGLAGDDGKSDYLRLKGESWVHHGYDKNDRLVSTERDTGLLQLYKYDGNSQKIKDILSASFDVDGDGLPDSWEYANDLSFTGTSAATGNNGPQGDPDDDGFTNLAEWKAGTDPQNPLSHPSGGATSAAPAITAATGFTPTNWVMATGQLDGYGADDVVVGADGAIGTISNSVRIITGISSTIQSTQVPVGNFGVNSLSIGTLQVTVGNQIVIGSKAATGIGRIQKLSQIGNTWNLSVVPYAQSGAGTNACIVGLANGRPVTGLNLSGRTDTAVFTQDFSRDQWSAPGLILSDIDGMTLPSMVGTGSVGAWKSNHELHLMTSTAMSAPADAARQTVNDNALFVTSEPVTYGEAVGQATAKNGFLVTIDSLAKNDFVNSLGNGSIWLGLKKGYNADAGNPASWTWASGSSSGYRNWTPGQPLDYTAYGSNSPYYGGSLMTLYTVMNVDGKWTGAIDIKFYDYNQNVFIPSRFKGVTETLASSLDQILPLPLVSQVKLWKGRTLTTGSIRVGAGYSTSLVSVFIDDKALPAGPSAGDDFVVGEYDLSVATPIQRTLVRLPLTSPNSAGAYGLTTIRRANPGNPSTLIIGEPDGTISLWTAPDATSPLVRKIFSTEFKGKSWHQLEPLKEANGREGLVGLLVDPARPNQCQVIHWSPDAIETAVIGLAPLLNNLPIARVLATPSSGGSQSSVGVRAWDAEAHSSTLTLQFQKSGQTTWTAARLLTADGNIVINGSQGITAALATAPGGQSHTIVWDAVADLGGTFAGTVLLRTRATDSETGVWSASTSYTVDVTSDLDDDGDGFTNAQELAFGTNPSSSSSRPFLSAVRNPNGSLQLTWPSAAGHTYRLETSMDLRQWTPSQSGLAAGTIAIPTSTMTDTKRFYRIAAE